MIRAGVTAAALLGAAVLRRLVLLEVATVCVFLSYKNFAANSTLSPHKQRCRAIAGDSV
jgi:hypothetical protein